MGIRCSLLGHEFGPPETERNREERGDEVVITIRELQVCTRCGAEQVTSESTEVRPVRPAPDSVTEEETATPDEPAAVESDEASTHPTAGGDDPDPDVEDDAVILENDDESTPARDPGQWPDADDTRMPDTATNADEPEPAATPPDATDEDSAEDTDEEPVASTDPQPTDEDDPDTPHPADADEEPPETADWPDPGPGDDEGFDATTPTDSDDDEEEEYVEAPDDPDSGIVSPSEETVGIEDVDTIFVCPSCEFQQPVNGSSLRSGDICPNCRKGYLTEQST